jgi:hypothetical protein
MLVLLWSLENIILYVSYDWMKIELIFNTLEFLVMEPTAICTLEENTIIMHWAIDEILNTLISDAKT